MNKEQEKEFFNQLEEVLKSHEDNYEPGAWEEFNIGRAKRKSKFPIYRYLAAAIVLLCVGIGFFEMVERNQQLININVVKNSHENNHINSLIIAKPNQNIQNDSLLKSDLITLNPIKKSISNNELNRLHQSKMKLDKIPLEKQFAVKNEVNPIIELNKKEALISRESQIVKGLIDGTQLGNIEPILAGAYTSLMNDNRDDVSEKSRKLTYALVVAPSLHNQKMNFGAGLEISYEIGSRLSINSGLMYASFYAKSEQNRNTLNRNKPVDASLEVTGVEFPLGIQYQTKNGFYASAGVSAMGLINERLEFSFLKERTISTLVKGEGGTQEVLTLVSERKTEQSNEKVRNYMNFFNFSAGKKQSFGNIKLNIGPFVKLPFASVSSERIKLIQGGIKIGMDF